MCNHTFISVDEWDIFIIKKIEFELSSIVESRSFVNRLFKIYKIHAGRLPSLGGRVVTFFRGRSIIVGRFGIAMLKPGMRVFPGHGGIKRI